MNEYLKWFLVCLLILNIFIFGIQFIENGFPKKEVKEQCYSQETFGIEPIYISEQQQIFYEDMKKEFNNNC